MADDNSVASGSIPYRTKTVTLAAGETKDISGNIKFLTLVSATNLAKVQVSFNGSSYSNFPPGFNVRDFVAEIFWLKNTDVVSNTIVVAIGQADLRDSRVVIDAANPLPVTITSGVVSVVGTFGNNTDAEAVKATGLSQAENFGMVFNGATWDRLYGNTSGLWAQGPVAPGAAAGGNPVQLGAAKSTDSTVDRVKTDGSGSLRIRVTDNTNYMPTMDAAARKGFVQITDGTNSAAVIATILSLKTDFSSIAGVATSVGSGTNGTGVQRVTLATDQAACTVAGLFSVKVDQTTDGTTNKVAANVFVAGAVSPGGNGTVTANCQRVVLASDQTANSNPFLVKGNISDNTAVGATSNLPVLPGRYDATSRSLTAGNNAFQSLDATGAEIIGNSNKASFSYTLNDIAATTGTWNAFSLEQPAGPTKTLYLKRIVVWNPGKVTTPATILVQLLRQTTAAATGDGAMTPLVHDTADTATAVGRYGNATSVTAGTTGAAATSFAMWVPAAVAAAPPLIIDLTNGGSCKGIVIPKTANNGVLVRVLGAAGASNLTMTAHWTEEAP